MTRHTLRTARSKGMTLIEVMLAGAILMILVGAALGLFLNVNQSVGEALSMTESAMQANKVQTLIKQELRAATSLKLGTFNAGGQFVQGLNNRSPVGNFTSVQYRVVTGFTVNPVAPVLSEVREIRFAFDAVEGGGGTGTDTDSDRDQRIDEGRLILLADRNNDGETRSDEVLTVLGHDISGDDVGFSFPSGGDFASSATPPDLALTVQFTNLIRRGTTANADGTTGEQRALVIALRNASN